LNSFVKSDGDYKWDLNLEASSDDSICQAKLLANDLGPNNLSLYVKMDRAIGEVNGELDFGQNVALMFNLQCLDNGKKLKANADVVYKDEKMFLYFLCDNSPEGIIEVYLRDSKEEGFKVRARRDLSNIFAKVSSDDMGELNLNLDQNSTGGSLFFMTGDHDVHAFAYELSGNGLEDGIGFSVNVDSPWLGKNKVALDLEGALFTLDGDHKVNIEVETPLEGYESMGFTWETSSTDTGRSLSLDLGLNGEQRELGLEYDIDENKVEFQLKTPVPGFKQMSGHRRVERDAGDIKFSFQSEVKQNENEHDYFALGFAYDFSKDRDVSVSLMVVPPSNWSSKYQADLKLKNVDLDFYNEFEATLKLSKGRIHKMVNEQRTIILSIEQKGIELEIALDDDFGFFPHTRYELEIETNGNQIEATVKLDEDEWELEFKDLTGVPGSMSWSLTARSPIRDYSEISAEFSGADDNASLTLKQEGSQIARANASWDFEMQGAV
jgi:hypothetical protein